MKRLLFTALSALFISIAALAADFTPYPGATLDEEATAEARGFAVEAKLKDLKPYIYTTPDPFEKVAAFYKARGRELIVPGASGTGGKPKKKETFDLWEAYFLLDNATDLESSRLWVKVQRPYVSEEIKDLTVIIVTDRR